MDSKLLVWMCSSSVSGMKMSKYNHRSSTQSGQQDKMTFGSKCIAAITGYCDAGRGRPTLQEVAAGSSTASR